jgi:hypothetical protein
MCERLNSGLEKEGEEKFLLLLLEDTRKSILNGIEKMLQQQ